MKFGGHKDLMLISMHTKNQIKIPCLGPNMDLCLLRKKVSTTTKGEIAYKPIIGGSTLPAHAHSGSRTVPWALLPALIQVSPSLCGRVLVLGIGNHGIPRVGRLRSTGGATLGKCGHRCVVRFQHRGTIVRRVMWARSWAYFGISLVVPCVHGPCVGVAVDHNAVCWRTLQ